MWLKVLQSGFWAVIAFEKRATLGQNLNLERLKLESNPWWWINFAILDLKKFGQKRFKVVFKCSLLWRKKPLWDRIWTSRGWNLNGIEGWWINFAILNLKKFGQKRFKVIFVRSLHSRKKKHFETEFELREVEIGIKSMDGELILPSSIWRN